MFRTLFRSLGAALLLVLLLGTAQAQNYPCPLTIAPRTVAADTYTVATPDNCWLITLTSAGAVEVKLPAPGLIFPPGFKTTILPLNGGTVTLTGIPDSAGKLHKINGQDSITLGAGSGAVLQIQQDLNWYALPSSGTGDFPNLPPGTVLANPSPTTTQPAAPYPQGDTGVLLLGGSCPGSGFLCGAASPLTIGSGQYNTYFNIDGGIIGSGTDASIVHRKGGLPIAEAGVGFNDIDTDYHVKTVIPARFTASQTGTTLTVPSAPDEGIIKIGALVFDNNPPFLFNATPAVPANNTVEEQLTGTTGGAGTYRMSQSATVSSRTMISELFEDRLVIYNWQNPRAGWTEFLNDQGVSVFHNSGVRYLAFGSLVPNFVTGQGSGAGMALAYDMGSANGFWTCVEYGVNYQPCIMQASDLRFSTAFLDSLDNAVVEITPDGALTSSHPTRYALEALSFNLGVSSKAAMSGFVAGATIVTACTTASKFCVQVGTPPSFLVATTQVGSAVKQAGGSGGTNSAATTLAAVAVSGDTSISVASISGIANTDPIFITCGGGTANDPPFYTGTVNGAPSGSTVPITPALNCQANAGLAVVAKYATLTGITGTGTKFTAAGKVVAGALDTILGILGNGSYTVNPTGCAASVPSCTESVTATGGLTGAAATIAMGALTYTLDDAGAVGADTTRTYPQTPVQTTASDNGVGALVAIRYTDHNSVNTSTAGLFDMGIGPTGAVGTGWVRRGAPTLYDVTIDKGAGEAATIFYKDGGATKFTEGKGAANDWSLFDSAGGANFIYYNPAAGLTLGATGLSGVAIGSPTGGVPGSGNLNIAGGYYINNVPISSVTAIGWDPAIDPDENVIATVDQASTVSSIVGTVVAAVGATATLSVYKAPSGTACAAGTVLHSGSFNANGAANTNQTLTLTATALSAGDRLCLVTSDAANWLAGSGMGGVTVRLTTP